MCRTNLCRVIIASCAAAVLLGAPSPSNADCALTDWLFGHGQTTYAPPYSPAVCAPAAGACGCAPVQCAPAQPVCQPCTPTTTYRISYRPVPTVAYMPVVGTDPCSGCAVTTYRPTQTWTYQASLLPYPAYRVGYVPMSVGYSACAPCSGYSTSYGGCSSCAPTYSGCSSCSSGLGGCSSCSAGLSSSYVTSGGCSSCASSSAPLSGTTLPGPSDMSQAPSASSAPVTIGSPTLAPPLLGGSAEQPRTYAPGSSAAPLAPGAGPSPSAVPNRAPSSGEGSRNVEPPRIDGIPPIPTTGPQLTPAPNLRPESENRVTSRPVLQATYFQLLQSPPSTVPAQMISTPVKTSNQRVDDSGWKHEEN